MKHLVTLLLTAVFSISGMIAQDVTTVQAVSSDISDNLDLEALAAVFADAEDLENFEFLLNDPEKRLSNLDLNNDGYVDYLRVIETSADNARLITIQAVIGKDMYQDVATIDVEKDERGKTRVQVVGDVYMYGQNYVIEPVYVYRPRIYTYLWAPRISPWYSTYYWGFYPSYFHYWSPYSYNAYYAHVHHYHGNHNYYYRDYRRSAACAGMYKGVARTDYARKNPTRSFAQRNTGYSNRKDLVAQRPAMSGQAKPNTVGTAPSTKPGTATAKPATGSTRPAVGSAKPMVNGTKEGPSTTKPSVSTKPNTASQPDLSKPAASSPTSRPAVETKPQASQPVYSKPQNPRTNPSTRPSTAPSTRPSSTSSKPSVEPSTRPRTSTPSRPSARPSSKPSTASPSRGTSRPSAKPRSTSPSKPSVKPRSTSRPSSTRPSSPKPSSTKSSTPRR